jgi:hypothetical protein
LTYLHLQTPFVMCCLQASAVGKVVVSAPQPASPDLRAAACVGAAGSGSILITGGTGALGLLVASWLVGQQGVGQLLLLSRTGKLAPAADGSPASRQLHALLCGNAAVSIVAADAAATADSAAVDAFVREQLGGVLAGVVHAAGVLDDAALRNQTHAGLRRWGATPAVLTLQSLCSSRGPFFRPLIA